MMMFRNKKSICIWLLFIIGLFFTSCAKVNTQFIVSSDENGVISSAKCSFNDSIFYENKFQDSTIYYYVKLSKQENEELKKLILNLKQENSIPKFESKPGSAVFIVENGDVKFYEGNYSIPSPNIKKIFTLFRDKASAMKTCKKVVDFWNIEGVIPPDNPTP